jgi:antigen flippase
LPEDTTTAELSEAGAGTYGQILKSSFLVGGSQFILVLFRLVRGKAMAYLLGPAGFGLFSVYGSIEGLVEDIAGLGVTGSGVRQIAESAGTGDQDRIARTAAVLKHTSLILGLLGAVSLLLLAKRISILTFGGPQHTRAIALLSIAVVLQIVTYGQDAVMEGLRRLADYSKSRLFGFLFSTLLSLPVVYFFREEGVAPSLVLFAVMTFACSWWYRSKISIPIPKLDAAIVKREASGLLKLGVVLMLSALMQSSLAYTIRALILRKDGLDAAGLYQSAWTLGGMYVALIIKAMAADFYPRLTASARVDEVCNRLVNEQARIGLLLAGPGVVFSLTFSPLILTLLYTAKFTAAVAVLRWICLGTMLQVVTWPMGYIVVAKGLGGIFFWCELACAAVYGALAWTLIAAFGLNGAGMAFLGYCVFHGFLYYPITRRISGFRWSRDNAREGVFCLALIAAVCAGFYLLPTIPATALGSLAVLASCIYSVRVLSRLVAWNQIPGPVRKLIGALGFAPTDTKSID